jgi:predicted amidohydrolase
MYKDILTLSVVNFNAVWGNKEKNLNRIKGYIEAAAKKGSNMIVFPEMSLTSYDDIESTPKSEKMQTKLAETIPGPSTNEIESLAKKLGIYVILGMPEKDKDDTTKVYNSLAVFTPDGLYGSYRKMHLPEPEPNWADRGDKPLLLETPWGPIGVAICYDSYCFPEMTRYYAAKGARLYINSTAYAHCHGPSLARTNLEANCITNGIYIASANLCGQDVDNYFWGGSSIMGPARETWQVHYYAGLPFNENGADQEKMYTETIDLGLATRFLYKYNESVGSADFRPEKYIEMYKSILDDPNFNKKD